jgi:hypothetical protein
MRRLSCAAGGPVLAAAVLFAHPAGSGTWLIRTIAGGTGGPGPAREFTADDCAVSYAAGQIYAVGFTGFSTVVRRISMSTGSLRPVAGSGVNDFSPDHGPDGTQASGFRVA